MMKKYGVREVRPTITDIGATDLVPYGLHQSIREGYRRFCRKHPGFDDDAVRQARRESGRPMAHTAAAR